jgi:hypothetical protein
MLFSGGYYYYVILALQAFCLVQSFRRGTQGKWLWVIICLPVLGSVIYIYNEMINGTNNFRRYHKPRIDVVSVINPGAKLKKLEENLRFTDTFANKVQLADAYLEAGLTDKAIDLYNASLSGAFAENEHVLAQLIMAYSAKHRYDQVIPIAKRIYRLPQFARSKAHLAYAVALEHTGQIEPAENEFKLMKGRYSYFEQRYQYGLFLTRQERFEDARKIFGDMLNEEPHLSAVERKSNRNWLAKAKEELRKIPAEKTA